MLEGDAFGAENGEDGSRIGGGHRSGHQECACQRNLLAHVQPAEDEINEYAGYQAGNQHD